MNPERWRQIDQLLEAALDQPPAQRAAFLAAACCADEALRRAVEALLRADAAAQSFIEAPVVSLAGKALARAQAGALTGRELGHYKILAPLGAGGMGEVYLAQDTQLGRKVALKLLPARFTTDAERVRRFEQEGRAASALNHPNIITIHEIGRAAIEDGGAYYIATEFVEGRTLRRQLADGRMKLREAVEVALQVASALAAAHAAGIVHRDIKPENVMLRPDGYVKVLDFGLAKLTEQSAEELEAEAATPDSTLPGRVLGTVRYMSPEQARGLKVDARTDIFSLGVVLYEMVTGQAPFAGATTADVIAAVLDREPPPLQQHAPDAPPELEQIVDKALRKDRAERYQTIKDLLDDLKDLKHELEFAARRERENQSHPPGAARAGAARAGAARAGAARAARSSGPILPMLMETARIEATPTDDGAAVSTKASAISSGQVLLNEVKRHKLGVSLTLAAFGALLLVLAVWGWLAWRRGNALAKLDSIAVLPFTSLGAEPLEPSLRLGLADALITRLGSFNRLEVRPTAAVRRYTEREFDPLQAGRDLGVEALVTGHVQRENGRLRVTVQVLRIADKKTLWAGQFDESFTQLFALQDRIAAQTAVALRLSQAETDPLPTRRSHAPNLEAYQLYLRGRYFWNRRTPEWIRKGIECFAEAIRLDPDYALAYAGLADSYALTSSGLPPLERMIKSRAAAERALQLDPALAEAHASLGFIRYKYDTDWAGAEQALRRAIELNPSYSTAHHWLGECLSLMGRFDEALVELRRAEQAEPLSLAIKEDIGLHWYRTRQFDRATQKFLEVRTLDPNYTRVHHRLMRIYELQGRYEEALAEQLAGPFIAPTSAEASKALQEAAQQLGWRGYWQKFLALYQAGQVREDAQFIALVYLRLGDQQQALTWLEKSFAERGGAPLQIKTDPIYDPLRSEPRFNELLRRAGHKP